MVEVKMKAYPREEWGKQAAKRFRKNGMIPAVIYGHKEETTSICIDASEFTRMLRREKGDNVIVNLSSDEKQSKKTIIREVQRNPVTSEVIHVDFQHLIPTEMIEMDVPIVLVGTAAGVKEGGLLEHIVRKISVKCLPKNIPSHLELDVSELDIGASVHVSDLSIKDVEILDRPEEAVVTVVVPRAYEEAVEKVEEVVGEEEEGAAEGEAEEGKEKEGEREKEKPAEKE
jgi:large subunit ribosomal protein L25